ncbi:lipocalin family protein [Luteimonas sp. MC1825]|uniref:lipocalin family protein n=1 Tax=Luteimonas sp. MC1825 TaxID=2761107 RepID=UPI00161D6828|nr:lipocalin family protein [Luteimonas sp. MC1825]MBB6600255.1 lipocalin family protein [Luteimonas sp. MC1825]QOC87939.1 lipocalin family protein [Luteimonas sp. MC1825]
MTAKPNHRPALRMFHLLAASALGLLLAACGATRGPAVAEHAETVPAQALDALMGNWHVAARVPWFGERGRVAHRVRFTADGDGHVAVHRTWRKGFAEPEESDDMTARRSGHSDLVWSVRLFGVVPGKLRILEVAEDGSWMLMDAQGRDIAWILTRAQVVEDAAYLELEKRIGRHGVNTDKLRRVPQVPAQEGKLGFEPAAAPTSRR